MISRRAVVLLGATAGLAGCSGAGTSADSGRSTGAVSTDSASASTAAPSPSTPSAPAPTAGLPAVRRWQPDPGDLQPASKVAAVHHVEKLGNGSDRALQVLEAQYGGLLTGSASVLVVTRSWRLAGSRVRAGGHTYDVRLSRSGSAWRVTTIHASRPGPATRGLSRAAQRVLASKRIELPPAGRADVSSGQVHDSVLLAMLTVSRRHLIRISVVRSGHPILVFGTDRHSDHPQGRAFDTWAIDGHEVVDPSTPRALVTGYMESLSLAGSYNVGGPTCWAPPRSGSVTALITTTSTRASPPERGAAIR